MPLCQETWHDGIESLYPEHQFALDAPPVPIYTNLPTGYRRQSCQTTNRMRLTDLAQRVIANHPSTGRAQILKGTMPIGVSTFRLTLLTPLHMGLRIGAIQL